MPHTILTGHRFTATKAERLLSPLAVFCSSVASAVALATLFLFAPLSAQADTVLSLDFPLSNANSETSFSLNGAVITDPPNTTPYPLLSNSTILKSARFYVVGTNPERDLRLILNNGSSNLDCSSELKTGDDYGVTATAKLINFSFTGTQCSLNTGQRYEWRLSYGSGSGYAIKGLSATGAGAYEISDTEYFVDSTYSNTLDASLYIGTFDTKLITASSSGSRNTPTLGIQYFLDPDEYTFSNTPTAISASVYKISSGVSTFVGQNKFNILSWLEGTSTRSFTMNTALDANSSFKIYINFWNLVQDNIVFSRTSITLSVNTNNTSVTSYVVESVIDGTDFIQADWEDCSLTNWSGCFNNSMRFLFVPSSETLNEFTLLQNDLNTKIPFVYTSQIDEIISNLFPSGTTNFELAIETDLGEVVFFNTDTFENLPAKELIRGLINAFLWLSFAMLIYRKTLAIHDKTV